MNVHIDFSEVLFFSRSWFLNMAVVMADSETISLNLVLNLLNAVDNQRLLFIVTLASTFDDMIMRVLCWLDLGYRWTHGLILKICTDFLMFSLF